MKTLQPPSPTIQLFAQRMRMKPEDVDMKVFKRARHAVSVENNDYWNGLANVGQMHGNVPKSICVCFVYKFLTEE